MAAGASAEAAELMSIPIRTNKGEEKVFADYAKDKIVLVVNVASKCGFTPQYEGLEKLYEAYKDRGFVVLGCPCNQFGGQEPGTDAEIEAFACTRFKTSFPLTSKMDVSGASAHPLYKYLGKAKPGFLWREAPAWNFTKFLVNGKTGEIVERYAPTTSPEAIAKDIEKLL